MSKRTIALDGDNVLLDYSTAYAGAWERAFGQRPTECDPNAYWPMHRWGVPRLEGIALERFRACFDSHFWSTMPAVKGSLDACQALHDAGYTLICVSALDCEHQEGRLRNLRELGFPIERVIATGSESSGASPKANALAELAPVAFVDDYLPYLKGLKRGIHRALIERQPNGSPNVGEALRDVDSKHADLLAFSVWWLSGGASTSQHT